MICIWVYNNRLFDQDGHQDGSLTLPIVQTLLPVTFAYSLSSEAVLMRQVRRRKRMWQRSLTRSHKRTSMGPSRSCWNGTSALQLEEITSKGTRVSCVYYQQKWSYERNLETYRMHLVYKEYLALNNLQWLICRKIQRNQIIFSVYV